VEQLLRQKREELVRRWEERETRLEAVRLKEKALEDRVRKRRRVEENAASRRTADDEEAEWLLDDPDDRGGGSQDPLSGLSKESREILTKVGLGGWKGRDAAADEGEELLEEGIKVRTSTSSHVKVKVVTLIDLLYLKNAFPVIPVHCGAPSTDVSVIFTYIHGPGEGIKVRSCETPSSLFATKALHQPIGVEARLRASHQ
jgi:hypothetical protein